MKYKLDIKIPRGEFPSHMTREDISEFLKSKITNEFSSVFYNEFQMPPVGNNTTELSMDMILILNPQFFLDDVKKLLDDHGISKKEFYGKLWELINNSK